MKARQRKWFIKPGYYDFKKINHFYCNTKQKLKTTEKKYNELRKYCNELIILNDNLINNQNHGESII